MKYEIRKIEKVENPIGRVLGRSNNNANANAGVAYANTNNAASNSNTNNGGRLCIIAALLLESRSRDGLTFRTNRCYGVHLRVRCWLTARDLRETVNVGCTSAIQTSLMAFGLHHI